MKVHERIRQYIEQSGLKRNHVAEKADIPVKRFYRLIDGSSSLTADEYEQICKKGLSVSPSYFFEHEFFEMKKEVTAASA